MITQFCHHKPNGNQVYRSSTQPFATESNAESNAIHALNPIGPILQTKQYTPVSTRECKNALLGQNPLLIDPMRGQRLLLNTPHFESGIAQDLSNVYTPTMREYGRKYASYKDINAGRVQYWVPDKPEVYFRPVFTVPSRVVHSIYTDPMDVQHPHFERVPNECQWNACVPQATDSFTKDTIEFREQLMARQMRRENERDYRYRVM